MKNEKEQKKNKEIKKRWNAPATCTVGRFTGFCLLPSFQRRWKQKKKQKKRRKKEKRNRNKVIAGRQESQTGLAGWSDIKEIILFYFTLIAKRIIGLLFF